MKGEAMKLTTELQQFNLTNIHDAIDLWEQALDYLEKQSLKDLGDFTEEGKIRNAGDQNFTLYWKWYKTLTGINYQGNAYCAGAGAMMFVTAFGKDRALGLLQNDFWVYCPDVYNAFKAVGRVYSKAQVGDIVLFWSDSLNRYSHFGIVTKVLTNGYVTWEANTSSGNNIVIRNGGATCRKSYTYAGRKSVFCRPDYAKYGINTQEELDVTTYPIKTGQAGLKVTASSLNIRKKPNASSTVIGSIKKDESVYPNMKAFDNSGKRWYYLPDKGGWVSSAYLHGWIQEENGRWWYLLSGNKWYADELAVIDGEIYAFDAAGYMVTEPITLEPDENGVLRIPSKAERIG